jgi:hypothetical protein
LQFRVFATVPMLGTGLKLLHELSTALGVSNVPRRVKARMEKKLSWDEHEATLGDTRR